MPESVLIPAPVSATNVRPDSRSNACGTMGGAAADAGIVLITASVRPAWVALAHPLWGFSGVCVRTSPVGPYGSPMRSDWVPLSASALVLGAMALVLGGLLNPAEAGASTATTLDLVGADNGRWVAMAVMYFLGSVGLTLGLPALLTLFTRRGRKLGLAGVALFTVGALGTCGYSMLLVFFRAMVLYVKVDPDQLERLTKDSVLTVFLAGWIVGFYGGVLLIAVALLVARATPPWVPWLLVVFVVLLPFSTHLGRVGTAAQVLALAVAFTGVAMAAVTAQERSASIAAAR